MPSVFAPSAPRPQRAGSPTVLVVEDSPDVRAVLSRLLTRRGLAVTLAEDATAGMEIALADRPDLVLMELNMPGEDGRAASGRMRAAPAGTTCGWSPCRRGSPA